MEFIGGLYQGDYWFARFLLQRAIGFIYLLAFINALNQFIPLLGEDGLLPLPDFLERMTFKEKPSIFHWYYSDQFFKIVAWSGIGLSLLAVSGITDSGPFWLSMVVWLLLWILYLSIVNVGVIFTVLDGNLCCWKSAFMLFSWGLYTGQPPFLSSG